MKTTNEILIEGYEILSEKLGLIDAEKFIDYIQRESFDYTKWQREFFKNKSALEINTDTLELRKNENK